MLPHSTNVSISQLQSVYSRGGMDLPTFFWDCLTLLYSRDSLLVTLHPCWKRILYVNTRFVFSKEFFKSSSATLAEESTSFCFYSCKKCINQLLEPPTQNVQAYVGPRFNVCYLIGTLSGSHMWCQSQDSEGMEGCI